MSDKEPGYTRRDFVRISGLSLAAAAAASTPTAAFAGHARDKAKAIHFDVGGTANWAGAR